MHRSVTILLAAFAAWSQVSFAEPLPTDSGYRGIWYMIKAKNSEYPYKYSGGMATYPQQHAPIAMYASKVNKTFFIYGGVAEKGKSLLHTLGCFDHATGTFSKPRILLDKKTGDAHDNPTLSIDDAGHLWAFSASHGVERPSYIHRSVRPYDITEFDRIEETNFSYPQPWHLPGNGFLFLHTKYAKGRGLSWSTSPDGRTWSNTRKLAFIAKGDYQVSWVLGDRVATAFDYHPEPAGLDARTNIYYLETRGLGGQWTTISGESVKPPLTNPKNSALVRDYESEGKLVYLKDLNYTPEGHPVILFLTSKGAMPGPENGPYEWHTARWTGTAWEFKPMTTSDHNYDHGSLMIDRDGSWRVIAPTETGPQAFGTGGQMVLWTSADQGKTWNRVKQLTHDKKRNHSYARRPLNAHPDFAVLWADGDAFKPSGSWLYFTDKAGSTVYRLPTSTPTEATPPEKVW